MKPFAAILSAMILFACLALPGTALESKVLTISERSMSMDLGPSFQIYKDDLNVSGKGMVSQDFVINDTAQPGAAFLSVISVYDEVLSQLDPALLSELFLQGGMIAVQSRGDAEAGNWTATDSAGTNVTVHTMTTEDPRVVMLGGTYDIAAWNLDGSTYALMVSMFDQNTTQQMIGTLTLS